jgi:hypothetical protein
MVLLNTIMLDGSYLVLVNGQRLTMMRVFLHVVFSLALSQSWSIHQLNVKITFPHGTLMKALYYI